ncbi:MAG: hypothetical protein LLF75_05180 [Eubacteriales bacterium]|nr:hypothetical protein [Eubacteriales bacterium]
MNLKQRLRGGEHLLGTVVTTFASADMAKLLKQYGFDFFIIDCEHGAFATRSAATFVIAATTRSGSGIKRAKLRSCMQSPSIRN